MLELVNLKMNKLYELNTWYLVGNVTLLQEGSWFLVQDLGPFYVECSFVCACHHMQSEDV